MKNMEELKVGDQRIRYDQERTLRAYHLIERGGAEECGCNFCRNFIAQRSSAYPKSILNLLEKLGIDFRKEGEIYEIYTMDGRSHCGGWFFFAGELIEAGEYLAREENTDFEFHFADTKQLPKPSVDFGDQVLAIDFTTTVPSIA
jgi:hypothetical protein